MSYTRKTVQVGQLQTIPAIAYGLGTKWFNGKGNQGPVDRSTSPSIWWEMPATMPSRQYGFAPDSLKHQLATQLNTDHVDLYLPHSPFVAKKLMALTGGGMAVVRKNS
ncbi:hypothetical protein JCM33374_g5624 [Metschnikowia sp. JCM 33374]|nr:hypothetical protein JCM33374_g5624 [Metschnikowia sp. JCM 33374]